MAEFTYEVKKILGVIGTAGKNSLELRLISWNGAAPKYDLRSWYKDAEGNERCNKGITLTEENLNDLYEILKDMDIDGDAAVFN